MSTSVAVSTIVQQAARKNLDIPSLFKQFIALPTVTRAQFLQPAPVTGESATSPSTSASASTSTPSTTTSPSLPPVWITTSSKNISHDETRTVQQTYTWSNGRYTSFGYPTPVDLIVSLPSPSRKLIVNVRTAPTPKGATPSKTPAYVFEIVDSDPASPNVGRILHTSPSTASTHGKILLAGNFGSIVWNSTETAIVYMAQPKADDRKPANYFPSAEDEEKQRSQTEPSFPTKGTEWEAKEDWGEQLVGIVSPRPFVVRFSESNGITLHGVKGIPDSVSAGQAIWAGWKEATYADDAGRAARKDALFEEGLYITIYSNNQFGGRKLGMTAYNSRESRICYLASKHIVDARREAEDKKAKEAIEKGKKEAEDIERQARGESITPEEAAAQKSAAYAKAHALKEKERNVCHLINLTPTDHSAQNPRLDGYDVPQLIYTTTDKVWHHIAGSKLKTWITLPATLTQFMKLVDQPLPEGDATIDPSMRPDGSLVQPIGASESSSSTSGGGEVDPSAATKSFPPMRCFFSNTHEMIPIVPKPASIDSFPGLWLPTLCLLPSNRFVFDRSHIFLSTGWRSRNVILLCSDEDDSLARLPFPIDAPDGASMSLYDVSRATGHLIVGVSSLAQAETLYVAELKLLRKGESVAIGENFQPVCIVHKDATVYSLKEEEDEDETQEDDAYAQIRFTPLTNPAQPLHPEAKRRLNELTMEIIQVPVNEKYEDGTPQLPFEAILLTPALDRTRPLTTPLLVFPHGGPHSVQSTSFVSQYAFTASVGISILFVNYRGSTAFGQAALDSLPGKIGDQDVRDCMAAIECVLARTGNEQVATRDNVHVQGGSHGGFLTTHLIGQYPGFFQTAAARNPVTNVAHMLSTTDIPDWCMFEATGSYDPLSMPTAADYERLFRASPIAHINKVDTPLMMLLGGADLRVPLSQAQDYVKLLKARGVRTRTLLYPDGQHPLSENPLMEGDVWCSMVMWLLKRWNGEDLSILGEHKY